MKIRITKQFINANLCSILACINDDDIVAEFTNRELTVDYPVNKLSEYDDFEIIEEFDSRGLQFDRVFSSLADSIVTDINLGKDCSGDIVKLLEELSGKLVLTKGNIKWLKLS